MITSSLTRWGSTSDYVYFKKEKVPAVEFEIDYYGKLREKYLNVGKDGNEVEFDHLPSQAVCKRKVLIDDPLAAPVKIRKKCPI
ncbi:hypothetical protein [Enterobacter cancerogenus]|uniref:hypothetical protein n=1 Tax=Enterobacter cancerogenus TaxID=69218 RepID=UPI00129972A2|nr:hypothetical protein [Enterobacter cancerogenus]QGG11339.1 hypothetical protein GH771_22385 [Enterobacter cancerogenus]